MLARILHEGIATFTGSRSKARESSGLGRGEPVYGTCSPGEFVSNSPAFRSIRHPRPSKGLVSLVLGRETPGVNLGHPGRPGQLERSEESWSSVRSAQAEPDHVDFTIERTQQGC